MTDQPTAAVGALLTRALAAGLIPSAVAAWGRGGRLDGAVSVGRTVIPHGPSPSCIETRYDLASLTKPLVIGPLCQMAMREGLFRSDTRLGNLDNRINGRLGDATIEHLLTHTSGLPAWEPLYARRPSRHPVDAIDLALGLALQSEPGTQVVYSCLGFIILGRILEILHGVGLNKLFLDRIAAPLGLTDRIGFRPSTDDLPGSALEPKAEIGLLAERGLDPAAIPFGTYPDDGNARFLNGVAGNAGLFGTAAAVVTVAQQFLVSTSQLFSREELEGMVSNRTAGAAQDRARAWQLASSPGSSAGPALAARAFGHTGFTGTSLWIDPSRDLVCVLLSNRHHPGHRGQNLHPLRRRFHSLVAS